MKDKDIVCITCEICGKFFLSVPALESHSKVKHHYKEFLCEVCGSLFTSKQAKESHCKDKNHLFE